MTRRALLLGLTDDTGLPGVRESVAAIADTLRRHHRFTDISERLDPDASTFRRLFAELAARTGPDDAVVIYYAGHGSRFNEPLPCEPGHVCHTLVLPHDVDAPDATEFRGLLGSEISRHIRALTRLTDNVTVILDCCYAADMLRLDDHGLDEPGFLAFERTTRLNAQAAVVRRRMRGPGEAGVQTAARWVLLLASASGGQSFPDPDPDIKALLFTRLLVEALSRAEAPTRPWIELILPLRRALREQRHAQIPDVAGEFFRLPFTATNAGPGSDYIPVDVSDTSEMRLEAGAMSSIAVDDGFAVYGAALAGETPKPIGKAVVSAVDLGHARLRWTEDGPLPPVVYLRRLADPRRPAPLAVGSGVTTALSRHRPWSPPAPRWRLSHAGEPPVARLELDELDDSIVVHDHLAERIAAISPAPDATSLHTVLEQAHDWWQFESRFARPEDELGDCCAVSWGLIEPHGDAFADRELAPNAELTAGSAARMYFRVVNRDRFPRLYLRAYRVRADRKIVHWQEHPHTGVCVTTEQAQYIGDQSRGHGRGISLEWPASLPRAWFRDHAAREWAVLCVANQPIARTFLLAARDANERAVRGDTRALHTILVVPYRLAPGAAPDTASPDARKSEQPRGERRMR